MDRHGILLSVHQLGVSHGQRAVHPCQCRLQHLVADELGFRLLLLNLDHHKLSNQLHVFLITEEVSLGPEPAYASYEVASEASSCFLRCQMHFSTNSLRTHTCELRFRLALRSMSNSRAWAF